MHSLMRRVAFGFVLALALALGAGWLVSLSLRDATLASGELVASARFLGALDAVLLTVVDAETTERGFAITGDRSFLQPYERALARFDVELAALRGMPEAAAHAVELDRIAATFARWELEQAGVVIGARAASPPAVTSAAARAYGAWTAVLSEHAALARGAADASGWAVRVASLEETIASALATSLSATARRAWTDLAISVRSYRLTFAPGGAPDLPAFGDAARLTPFDGVAARIEFVWALATSADDRVARLLVAGTGRELVPQIRALADTVRARERERLAMRAEVAQAAQERAARIAWFAPVGAVIVSLATVLAFLADLGSHVGRLAAATQALAEGRDVRRIGGRGPVELRRFTRAFDAMAERVRGRDREGALLAELSTMTQVARSLDEAVPLAAHFLPRLLPGSTGELWLADAGATMLRRAAAWGEADTPSDAVHADACWGLRQGRPYTAVGVGAMRCSHDAGFDGATLCVPLTMRGETLGVLTVRRQQAFGTDGGAARLVRTVAEQLALALANLRLREALEEQSIRDPLTGLFNRRFLEHSLVLETERASRSGDGVAVVMVDVDHFKRVNDTFGHDAGDAVLGAVAHVLSSHVRPGDLACRFGGEEFVLVLPGADAPTVEARAELLRDTIARLSVPYGPSTMSNLSASFGVAIEAGAGAKAERLLKRADEALYEAKRAGRDRVVVAPPLDESERLPPDARRGRPASPTARSG